MEIPLGNGRRGFGRDLGLETEFYDREASESDNVDVRELDGTPIAFRVSVMNYAFKTTSSWRVIGVLPVGEDEPRSSRKFKQDALTGALMIYWEDREKGPWREEPATLEDCAGLECAAVWDPGHIEDRLRDHFAGLPNQWVMSLAIDPDAIPTPGT